jgi:hypothetical protein
MTVSHQRTYRAYLLKVTCLADKVQFLTLMLFTVLLYFGRRISGRTFIVQRRHLLKLDFFHVFDNVQNPNIFWNVLRSSFSNDCFRMALVTDKHFAISFNLNCWVDTFLAKGMTTFGYDSRYSVVWIVLKFANRTSWNTVFWLWYGLNHERSGLRRILNFVNLRFCMFDFYWNSCFEAWLIDVGNNYEATV